MDTLTILMAVLPSVASIGATIVAVCSSIKRVKSAIGDTKETNIYLKKQLKEAQDRLVACEEGLKSSVESLKAQMELKEKEIIVVAQENKELKEAMAKVTELIDANKTIQDQLTVLLESEK